MSWFDLSEKIPNFKMEIQRQNGDLTSKFVNLWHLYRFVMTTLATALPTQFKRTRLFNKKLKQLCIEFKLMKNSANRVNLTHDKQQMWTYTNNRESERAEQKFSNWKNCHSTSPLPFALFIGNLCFVLGFPSSWVWPSSPFHNFSMSKCLKIQSINRSMVWAERNRTKQRIPSI